MAEIHQSAVVAFSARQMFALVNDITRYPEFLPWCAKAECLTQTLDVVRARLTVAKGGLHYTFTTDNHAQWSTQLEMRLVDGPFRRLHGIWQFVDNPLGSKVSLDLEFEFANRILATALSPLFKVVTGSLVNSFKQRAEQLYG